MKTPDEIKQALETCSTKKPCPSCPMWDECKEAASLKPLWDNALAYIQQLEADNAELLTKVEQLEAKCHQLERERDAAVADLAETKDCITCKHSANCKIGGFDCYHCNDKDCPCLTCQYEWRGAKEE